MIEAQEQLPFHLSQDPFGEPLLFQYQNSNDNLAQHAVTEKTQTCLEPAYKINELKCKNENNNLNNFQAKIIIDSESSYTLKTGLVLESTKGVNISKPDQSEEDRSTYIDDQKQEDFEFGKDEDDHYDNKINNLSNDASNSRKPSAENEKSQNEIKVSDKPYEEPISPLKNFSGKHQLQNVWCFWYAPSGKRVKTQIDNYEDNLTKFGEFDTVEDYLQYFHYLKRAYDIKNNNKLMLFKKGCIPMWENFPQGGSWIITYQKRQKDEDYLDQAWEQIQYACIGERFDSQSIIGVVLNIKLKENLIELWLNETADNTKQKIKIILQDVADYFSPRQKLYFKNFENSLKNNSILKQLTETSSKNSYKFKTKTYK